MAVSTVSTVSTATTGSTTASASALSLPLPRRGAVATPARTTASSSRTARRGDVVRGNSPRPSSKLRLGGLLSFLRIAAGHYCALLLLSSATTMSRAQQAQQDAADAWDGCDVESYYDGVVPVLDGSSSESSPLLLMSDLHDLLERTHRRVLPYTDSDEGDDDVWEALKDLDSAPSPDGSGRRDYVRLIYRQVDVPSNLSGAPAGDGGWTREHLWPKSRGVGYAGPDYTDVHHLTPSDWNVNSARGNKYFGSCLALASGGGGGGGGDSGEEDSASSYCNVPAHVEAADDTAAGPEMFLPPASVRGDVARAIMYMAVRYYPDLELTDCPSVASSSSEGAGGDNEDRQMAYLSELLRWHSEDPVDEGEVERNERACRRWQGNRNPFVDFEDLALRIFGEPRTDWPPACDGSDSSSPPDQQQPEGGAEEEGAPQRPLSCSEAFPPGSIAFVGLNSDDPDSVAMVALVDIAASQSRTTDLYLTDKAWVGSDGDFEAGSREGTLRLRIDRAIEAGRVWGYGDEFSGDGDGYSWEKVSGSFALSASGDTVLLYCVDRDDEEGDGTSTTATDASTTSAVPHFVAGLSYSGGWTYEDGDSSSSDLPEELQDGKNGAAVVTLDHADNYIYAGPVTSGDAGTLRLAISNASNWEPSNGERHGALNEMGFIVTSPSAAPSPGQALCLSTLLLSSLPFLFISALS